MHQRSQNKPNLNTILFVYKSDGPTLVDVFLCVVHRNTGCTDSDETSKQVREPTLNYFHTHLVNNLTKP